MKKTAALLFGIIVIFSSCQDKKETDTTTITEETTVEETAPAQMADSGRECFLQVIGKDSLMLSFSREGDNISGEYHWKHFEKDNKKGKFSGTLKNNEALSIAEASAEGMTAKEELQFTIEDNAIKVKFGAMEEGKDGIWHYNTNQPSSEQVLPKTECK